MIKDALAGVSGDVGAWMTQAEAWRQKAMKAEAELDRYRTALEQIAELDTVDASPVALSMSRLARIAALGGEGEKSE